ncbi:MAG: lipopolysaccharide biosynthesis protein [Bacilli bacterium]
MKKMKLFIENFLVYGFGGAISAIVPFLMLPIITRLMPNSTYFGISDMANTLISLAIYFGILGTYDAMFRVYFDKDEISFKKRVCSTALVITLISSFIVSFLLIILKNQINDIFFSGINYKFLIYIIAIAVFVTSSNSIVAAPVRMQNRKRIYILINFISPILSYSLSIILLIKGYYEIALPLGVAISGLITEIIFFIINRKYFSFKLFDKKIFKELLVLGVPLVPNFIIYWIFNSFDKIMITNFLNIGEAGIYSVGAKIASASQLIYLAFSGGWQYFSFSTMKEKNQVKNNSLVFEYLAILSFTLGILMCLFSKTIFTVLFEEEYLKAYIIAPYLFLAPLLLMLFQVASNQFLVVKKTWPNPLILLLGAVANIYLNYLLIPVLGIEGASIATLIGYIISVIIAIVILKKMKLMIISKRVVCCFLLLIIYMILWRLLLHMYFVFNVLAVILLIGIYIIIYKNDLNFLFQSVKCLKSNKNI